MLEDLLRRSIGETVEDIGGMAEGIGRRAREAVPVRRERRRTRKAPRSLLVAGMGGVLAASVYLYRLFLLVPSVVEAADRTEMALTMGMMAAMFVMYAVYLSNVFRVSAGNRRAWVAIERMSLSYVVLTLIAQTAPFDFLATDAWGIPSWALAAYMLALAVYMMLPFVRRFFTPGYANPVSAKGWMFYIVGIDPFDGKRQLIS